MAEVLLLLLFVLLLALTHALAVRDRSIAALTGYLGDAERQADEARREVAALGPIQRAIEQSGAVPEELARDIGRRLAQQAETERERDHARAEVARLQTDLAEAAQTVRQARELLDEARSVDPNGPPAATLRRALRQAAEARATALSAPALPRDTVQQLEAAARQVDPQAPPAATLQRGLESLTRTGSVTDVVVAMRDAEQRLGERLTREFQRDLRRWGANIDPSTLTIRFNNPDLLFVQGSTNLSPAFFGQIYDFFPRYMNALRDFKDDIEEVRIEGHTSSEWDRGTTPLEAYFNNMRLSQERARSVLLSSLTRTPISPEMRDWARGLITANGLSSSRLRLRSDGTEDPDASRRVEFRVVMKLRENVMRVVDGQR